MGQYIEHFDISYPHRPGHPNPALERQALDLYLPNGSNEHSPLLVWVHGGAWRSEKREDFRKELAPNLLRSTGYPVAVLGYRMAPEFSYPSQTLDIIAGLSYLTSELNAVELHGKESEGKQNEEEYIKSRWSKSSVYLIGHSVGAFITASLVLQSPFGRLYFTVPPSLRMSIKGVIGIDGIWDLPALLQEYPSYEYFVKDEFPGGESVWTSESPARWKLYQDVTTGTTDLTRALRFFILHSKGDELLSLAQPELFHRHLQALFASDESRQRLWGSVEIDYDTLDCGHYQIPKSKEMVQRVAMWVKKVETAEPT